MITTTGDYDKLKEHGQLDFVCEIEYDCLKAEATSSGDWTGGTGTADDTTKSGSIICTEDTVNELISHTTTTTYRYPPVQDDAAMGIRLQLGETMAISQIRVQAMKVTTTSCDLTFSLYKVSEADFNFGGFTARSFEIPEDKMLMGMITDVNDANPTDDTTITLTSTTGMLAGQEIRFGATYQDALDNGVFTIQSVPSGTTITVDRIPDALGIYAVADNDRVFANTYMLAVTSSWFTPGYDVGLMVDTSTSAGIDFEGNGSTYVLLMQTSNWAGGTGQLQFKTTAITTEEILDNPVLYTYSSRRPQGEKFDFGTIGFSGMGTNNAGNRYFYGVTLDSSADTHPPFDDDITILEDLYTDAYTDSTMFTASGDWFQVKDSDGTGTTPTTDGVFRLDLIRPEDTDYEIDLYGNSSATDTGRTQIQLDIRDGDAVTQLFDYYKFEITLETTAWHSTPQLKSCGVYFPIKKEYSINTDEPIIEDVPSINSEIDPLTSKASIDDINFNVLIHKPVQGLSEAENLFNDYYLSDAPVTIKQGFKGLDLSSYVGYHTGMISEWSVLADLSKIEVMAKGPLLQSQDKLGIDSDDGFEELVYNEMNAVEIVRDALRRTNINDRFINTTSFSNAVTTYDGYDFFHPFVKTPIKDAKKDVIDPISELLGAALIYKEDGQLHYQKLDDDSASVQYTWDKLNTESIGVCELNLESAVNSCAVQRGYWDQGTFEKSKDKPIYDLELNETSITDIGLKETLTIENKWVAKDVKISGDHNSKDIAERIVDRFGYGVWIVPVRTSFKYVDLQVGDIVNIDMPQGYIMIKDFVDRIYRVRAVVISKQPDPANSAIDWTCWIYQNKLSKV